MALTNVTLVIHNRSPHPPSLNLVHVHLAYSRFLPSSGLCDSIGFQVTGRDSTGCLSISGSVLRLFTGCIHPFFLWRFGRRRGFHLGFGLVEYITGHVPERLLLLIELGSKYWRVIRLVHL